jgi:hypothetical protein
MAERNYKTLRNDYNKENKEKMVTKERIFQGN